jgi:hypothetical protein
MSKFKRKSGVHTGELVHERKLTDAAVESIEANKARGPKAQGHGKRASRPLNERKTRRARRQQQRDGR